MTSCLSKYATVCCFHLGHSHTPAKHVIHNFKEWFKPLINEVSVLFFTGDMFDKLLTFPSSDTHDVMRWMGWLLKKCEINNIALRVLEGTRSHDWGQASMFNTIKTNCDFKWCNKLEIEYLQQLGLHVLYIPDELNRECSTTLKEVLDLLAENELSCVDIAMMHGAFKYQLPLLNDTHDKSAYEEIVKHTIYIGHIHTYNPSGKILPAGGFDRYSFAEQGAKGAIVSSVYSDRIDDVFVLNKNPMPYIVIVITDMTIDIALTHIREKLKDMTIGHVKIKARSNDPIMEAITDLRIEHPHLRIQKQRIKEEVKQITIVEEKATVLSKDNIVAVTEEYLKKNNIYDADVIDVLMRYKD